MKPRSALLATVSVAGALNVISASPASADAVDCTVTASGTQTHFKAACTAGFFGAKVPATFFVLGKSINEPGGKQALTADFSADGSGILNTPLVAAGQLSVGGDPPISVSCTVLVATLGTCVHL